MKGLLNQLRQETALVHEALHAHALLRDLFARNWTMERYRHFLWAFAQPLTTLGAHSSLPTLAPWLAEAVTVRQRALLKDLSLLAGGHASAELAGAGAAHAAYYEAVTDSEPTLFTVREACPEAIAAADRAYVLGSCYTLIGSSLGARQLHKAVLECLPGAPCNYLALDAGTSGWPKLARLLQGEPMSAAALRAALRAFRQIEAGFDAAAEASEVLSRSA